MKRSRRLPISTFWITVIIASILFVLLLLSSISTWYQARNQTSSLIVQHIQELHAVFQKIDQTCGIIDFDHQKNYIDFLNVGVFTGSEVGSMNLAHPDKWKGPYLSENPTIQEQNYQIVRTKKGFFIVPGDGVVLSNGKTIGKDIIFDENADIQAMTLNESLLNFNGQPLAVRLPMKGSQSVDPISFTNDSLDLGMAQVNINAG